MKFTQKELLYAVGLLITGLLFGWLLFSGLSGNEDHADNNQLDHEEMEQHVKDTHTNEDGEIIYTCSMHPQIRENEPGSCPICGMELIPASESDAEAEENDYSMVMTESAAKLAQIQTSPVIRTVPEKELDLPGRIRVDERKLTNVTAYFPGRIQDIKVDFTGAPIRKGEPMATIYSPELISAQRELLEAGRQQDRNPRLYESARQKFRLWEFTDEQIDEIVNSGEVQRELEIRSPVDGYVLSRNIANQQYVSEGTVIYEVADLSQVWVVLEAYEEDVEWIDTGDTITFRTRNNPGEKYEATVQYIDPVVDPVKRTVGVRADMDNPGHELKPDMLVSGVLEAKMDPEKLLVPASSVLWTGPRSLIYVQDTSAVAPRFEVREVELGSRAGDYYVIEEGVEEGEEVVFHGNFLIDSEFQLADKFSMMNREPGTGAGARGMPGMDMGANMDEEDHSDHQTEAKDFSSAIPDNFKEELTALLDVYLSIKDELTEPDLDDAGELSKNLIDVLDSIGLHRFEEDDVQAVWMDNYYNLMAHIEPMARAENLESFREDFRYLTSELTDAVKTFGVNGKIYQHYCPMAFNNEGAYWLSEEEEIVNPYMEEAMRNCGETKETLE